MKITSLRWLQVGLTIGCAALLSACGGEASTRQPVTPPKVVTTAQEDKFGTAFGQDFRADPNSEPAVVSDTDIVPVSATDESIDITG